MLFFEWIIVGLSFASLIDAGRLGKRAIEESNEISDLIATLSTNKHVFSAYFSERFEIKHLIGRGSNGAVFKAKDFQSARDVAVKFQYINHKRCTQLSEVDIMLRIARQPEAIRTKINTVGYIGCGVERHGLAYIVSELIENDTDSTGQSSNLRGRMEQRLVTPALALHILTRLAITLDTLHQLKIYHQDIKPDNILVNSKNEVFLIDFGNGGVIHGAGVDATAFIGSPGYASPQALLTLDPQLSSTQPVFNVFENDVYALGVTYLDMLVSHEAIEEVYDYEMFVRERKEAWQEVGEGVYELLKGMLADEEDDRWSLVMVRNHLIAMGERENKAKHTIADVTSGASR